MKQICIIHGGTTYETDADFRHHLEALEIDYTRLLYRPRWNNWIAESLANAEVLLPSMPNNANARYNDWSVYFSKILPFLSSDAILIGHSLGGIFLAKYLNEHDDSVHFQKVILIAAPYNDESSESLASFRLPENMEALAKTADEFYLFHSKDDVVVPFAEVAKYKRILPQATLSSFENRGHFNTPTFEELLEVIKK